MAAEAEVDQQTSQSGFACPSLPDRDAKLQELLRASKFDQALQLLDTAIDELETAELWNDWATVQHAAAHPFKAEQGYRRALLLAPCDRQASVNLGLLLLEQGRVAEAAPLLDEHRHPLTEVERRAVQSFASRQARQQEKVAALERAVEFLLVERLNAQAPRVTGAASNQALLASFSRLLGLLAPRYFLDVGANDASAACQVKALLPQCEVWAFEANPEIHARFAPSVAARGVQYANLAMVATAGTVTMYAPRTLSRAIVDGAVVDMASVEPEITGKTSLLRRNEDATYREFTVEGISLDDFVAAKQITGGREIALWIDVEGAASEVLAGASLALEKACVVLIESENHEFWAGQKQAGEIASLLIAAGFLPLARDREYGDKQFNTVFLHHSFAHLVYPSSYVLPEPPTPPRRKPAYHSLAARLTADIPILIPVFNNPTYARNMLRQLSALGMRNVCLVDNGSSSPAMLGFLEAAEEDAAVIRTGRNLGPRQVVLEPDHFQHLPEIFCVTDPDLELNPALPRNFLSSLIRLTNELQIGKAGLALRIDDAAAMHPGRFTINGSSYHATEWEAQYWSTQVGALYDGSPVYKAAIDTTFAVYNKRYFKADSFFDAVRVAGNYTCRHLPWYRESIVGEQELATYRALEKHALCGA